MYKALRCTAGIGLVVLGVSQLMGGTIIPSMNMPHEGAGSAIALGISMII